MLRFFFERRFNFVADEVDGVPEGEAGIAERSIRSAFCAVWGS